MSVTLLCPACGSATVFHRLPVTMCPTCHAVYPEQLSRAAEATIGREIAPRPILLTAGIVGSAFVGGFALLFLLLSPLNIGVYKINGEPVSGREFFERAGALLATVAAICLPVAYGLWKERLWVRPLMLAFWIAPVVVALLSFGTGGATVLACSAAESFIGVAIAAAYLYGKRSVTEYYRMLKGRSRSSLNPQSPPPVSP